ncbi:MAG TPA: phosphoribosyltransferase family protein [Acidisarcina sp.]|nr:phosphoribosyltransferase family protein [Acidisarcina sp.]
MLFTNREDAGHRLAMQLRAYAHRSDVIVLGIPRGGVPVAFEIARELDTPLDIFLSRKLGVPGHEELAFGAVAAGEARYLDADLIQRAGITPQQIERITQEVKEQLKRRADLYRGNRPPLDVAGRTVLLVDDGIATGSSIYAAIQALRQLKPAKLVVAVPVAPPSTCDWLRREVDELICLYTPENFYSVGQFYGHFSQITDEEVCNLLRQAERPLKSQGSEDCLGTAPHATSLSDSENHIDQREVSMEIAGVTLSGTLSLPKAPKGIVLFAHGSGSSRHSPRNRYVARVLQSRGIATLLFDLLTAEEESIDRPTAELRFDIELLARRLAGATQWMTHYPDARGITLGYFGASTGAAAALVAAARLPNIVTAVVSRGGRPDLANGSLGIVRAPTLLIVGGDDEAVLALNRRALTRLGCKEKKLVIIPGATHLFEESGALERVAEVAAEWFVHYLVAGSPDAQKGAGGEAGSPLRMDAA